jgi:quercetin dioxygenase-like cupin family protein
MVLVSGKEGLMLMMEYPPGSADPIHRHNANASVYVLEGSIVMQVRGGKELTLTAGQTFYEGSDDVHVVGRNASQTKPAKFVVFLVKEPRRGSADMARRSPSGSRPYRPPNRADLQGIGEPLRRFCILTRPSPEKSAFRSKTRINWLRFE